MIYIRKGWSHVKSQLPSVIILFLYQLLWGIFLYRLIDTAVVSFLSRFPDPPPNSLSRILFTFEGQNEWMHHPIMVKYLWLLAGMLAIRMFLTPFIKAGIIYGLTPQHTRKSGLALFRGMREFWKPVALFYCIEIILISLPLLWIAPQIYSLWPSLFYAKVSVSLVLTVSAYLIGWALYCFMIRQCLLFGQFGYLFKTGVWSSLWLGIRQLLRGIAILLILGCTLTVISLLFGTASWLWTGLFAFVLQQSFPLIRCLFNIWGITSQYELWHTKTNNS